MTKSSTAIGAALSGLLACVVALEGPAHASTPKASAVSVNTPVCSYGRVDVASLDGRPGMKYFLDGAEAFSRKDYHHAIYMYKVAASWADKSAEYDLGLVYFRGEGVPVDRPLGAAWMVLAAESGNSLYVRARNLMVSLLTDAEFERMNELWNGLEKTYGDDGPALRRAKFYSAWMAAHRTGTHLPNGIAGNVRDALLEPGGSLQQTPIASVDDAMDHARTGRGYRLDDPESLKCPTGTVKVEPLQQVKVDGGGAPESSAQPARSGAPALNRDPIRKNPGGPA
ncbi:MAG TPA: hypothetical protein VN630_08405 [Rhodanobacteraceae bacterium]|nr:hypothetical protein [Rhodanobacteraceae bacterium]